MGASPAPPGPGVPALAEAQLAEFAAQGFLHVPGLVAGLGEAAGQVEAWAEEIARWPAGAGPYLQHAEANLATGAKQFCRAENFVRRRAVPGSPRARPRRRSSRSLVQRRAPAVGARRGLTQPARVRPATRTPWSSSQVNSHAGMKRLTAKLGPLVGQLLGEVSLSAIERMPSRPSTWR